MPDSPPSLTLVIGYGNTLRRDDALGCLIADEVMRWGLTGVRSLSLPQLTPDLALEMASAGMVIFVDARCCLPEDALETRIEPLLPDGREWASLDHALTPGVLLKFTEALYGCSPPGWLISVPGLDFSIGEALSREAGKGMQRALDLIAMLLAGELASNPTAR